MLRPGGRLLLVNMAAPERWYNQFWQALYRLSPRTMGGCRGVALSPYLAAAGFQLLEREYMSQLGFPSEVIVAVKG